jgi:Ca-activated chloride channel family protein
MNRRWYRWLVTAAILGTLLASCGRLPSIGGKTVRIHIYYGSEKEEWLEALREQYNAERRQTPDGSTIVVEATPIGSIESMERILREEIQPTVWSPASEIYVPLINSEWRKTHTDDLVQRSPPDLVLSPVVIAMWRPMAEVLGWPEKCLGWSDIAALSVSERGWEAYGLPEWGSFKLGHTDPARSNSGFISVLAEAYAGAGKQRDLTLEDLQDPQVKSFMAAVESSIIHYGSSTGFFATQMFERGPSYLSAAVMYENLVVAQESKRLAGLSDQLPVVAIYPKEGTFWSDHPYCILNAPWVSEQQRAAAEAFQAFLLDAAQQIRALEYGFRPADPAIALGAPLDEAHGVDPGQPQTVLETPRSDVLLAVQQVWREVKKPVDVVAVVDISGSMRGSKIASARTSLIEFIGLLDDRDRLQVLLFSEQLITLTPLSRLGDKRAEVTQRVSGIVEQGNTRLYDAVYQAHQDLQQLGDPKHIRAIVALSDGKDNASSRSLDALAAEVGDLTEGGMATKVFTIAFGGDADLQVLETIADSTGARMYQGDPETIREVYAEIATFF